MTKENCTSIHFDREKLEFVGLTEKKLNSLKKSYKNVDIDGELSRMKVWLCSARGIKRKGNQQFITRWLQKASLESQNSSTHNEAYMIPAPLNGLIYDYLKVLWKNREDLLNLNTLRK